MLNFRFESLARAPTILLLGAHCDDIEIGCAGTVVSCDVVSKLRANRT